MNKTEELLTKLINWFELSPTLNPVKSKYIFLETSKNGSIESQCNAISFINQGDEDVTIEGVYSLPVNSAMLTLGNGPSDYDTTNYAVKFAGGGLNPKLVVIKRMITGKNSYFNEFTLKGRGD